MPRKAATFVEQHKEELSGMTYPGLVEAGKTRGGFDSRSGFSAYIKALEKAGIDYKARQAQHNPDKAVKITQAKDQAEELVLFSDANAAHQRFGIVDHDHRPVWHGRFFDDDRDFNGEQSTAEMAAAKKAVWLAGKLQKISGRTVKLTLNVDAEWLTYANDALVPGASPKVGGKARALADTARVSNVLLDVQWISGKNNPADSWTKTTGFLKYQESELYAEFQMSGQAYI